MSVHESVAVRIRVFRLDQDEPLTFGLALEGSDNHSTDAEADIVSAAWGRDLAKDAGHGAAGRLSFVLPGREDHRSGLPWGEVISPNDYVELDVRVNRYPDPDGWGSCEWRTDWTGFIDDVDFNQETAGEELTVVTCSDQMGTLDFEHYSYWRNVGAVFAGSGSEGVVDILGALDRDGLSRMDLEMNSISGAAEALFRVMLYKRLMFSRRVRGEDLTWDQLHGYRFESDDFAVSVDVASLAPEGSSWMDAISWVVDAPSFYEFYLDNVPKSEYRKRLLNGGINNVGQTTQWRVKEDPLVLPGDRIEVFVIRPVPFPTYDPDQGGYRSSGWDSLEVIEALPFGAVNVSTKRSRRDVYSVYSVDMVHEATANADGAQASSAEGIVVGDGEAWHRKVGYRPLDVRTKRFEEQVARGGHTGKNIGRAEMARRLTWQSFSFSHFNDRFYAGSVATPLDLRIRLGKRYLCEGMLYYIEGYMNSLDATGASSTVIKVSRGLTCAQYGYTGGVYPQHALGPESGGRRFTDEKNLFPDYLGRQRPGEKHAPVSGNAVINEMVDQLKEPSV